MRRMLAVRCVGVLAAALVMAAGGVAATGAAAAGGVAATGAGNGAWVWPLEEAVTVSRPFDPPSTRYGPGHRGADLVGRPGQAVRAAGAGRISYAGLLAGRGVVVVVHGDLRTTYEPVTATVGVGQLVAAGDVLGRLMPGHPGCPATCLHWGLLRGQVYLDPVRLVRAGPSRLLPVDGTALAATGSGERGRPAALLQPTPMTSVAADPPPGSAPRPAIEPAFVLRAADAGWGAAALLALVAGLALLRPRRPPDGPAAPSLSPAATAAPLPEPTPGGLVDLTTERHRRRPEVA